MDALFTDTTPDSRPIHGCTGEGCAFCLYQEDVKTRVNKPAQKFDEIWLRAVTFWRKNLQPGDTFTADDLIHYYGLPVGHTNQIGSLFSWWQASGLIKPAGRTHSTRESNNGRSIIVWKVVK